MTVQSKPQQNQQQKPKTIQELIHDFCQDLEKGDLGMNKLIKNGYLLYGQTRSGKTAASHLLSGNALKGVKIGGEEKVENSTSKNKNAIIGNTSASCTRIPNFFPIKHPSEPQEKAFVIDTPGYGDTYGTFRLLGNGYYHYKLYSKVQNMKFILCFDQIQLQNTAQLFIDTIVQFTSYFKDYADNKEEIWKSCVFLINKVDENAFSLDDLKTKMREIQKSIKIQKKQQEINLIKEFINYILENDRVFTIKKYKLGDSATRADLLKVIDEKSNWWSRPLNEKNKDEVEMEPILFNISKPILVELTRNDLSKQEFIKLMDYYNDRINQILQASTMNPESLSLDFVLCELVKDAMGEPNSHNFLKPMENYIDKYYHIYDQNYKEQREKLEKEMFQIAKESQSVNPSQEKAKRIKDKNFIVKKFQVLEKVEQIRNKTNYEIQSNKLEFDKKSMAQKSEEMKMTVESIVKEFNKVAYKKKNRSEIIYKYGYIIHRVISEIQVMLLLMGSAGQNEKQIGKNKIIDAADGKFLSLTTLINFMGLGYKFDGEEVSCQVLKQKFIKEVDLNSEQFSKLTINWPLVDLFSSVKIDQGSQAAIQKVIVLLEKFSEQFLAEKQTKQQNYNDTVKLIQKLAAAQVNCHQLLTLEQNQDRKDQYSFIIRRITNNIGKLLESIKKYSLARQVYNSVLFVDCVCNLYEIQIKGLTESTGNLKEKSFENKPFRLRIEYGTYLKTHGREKEAIITFQKAFQSASNRDELAEIKEKLSEALLGSKEITETQESYEHKLFQGDFYTKFSEELVGQLQNLSANNLSMIKSKQRKQ